MHTSDMHTRVLNGDGYPDDLAAVKDDFDLDNCDVCLSMHEDDLAAIREFVPTIAKIEKIVRHYRMGMLMPWEVESKLADILRHYD
jgi:hypothetical protein